MLVFALLFTISSFFSGRGDHRDLHSFPTRRSSDLAGRDLASAPGGNGLPYRLRHAPRSEEHTSELQSRRELVCRLLLEKKKTYCTIGMAAPQLLGRLRFGQGLARGDE